MHLFETKNLKKYFKHRKGEVRALDGVDLFIKEKTTTALVGESGCGKTTLAKTALGFYSLDGGRVYFDGKDITDFKRSFKTIRENIQIVFQNPFLSFNPRYTVFATLYEALCAYKKIKKNKAKDIVVERLKEVGLNQHYLFQYPHQLSGGELQRVSLARALINRARLILLDEPTSSLDVYTTVKIIELLSVLQAEFSTSFLFISHNLKLVRKISDFIFVMYYGRIVEYGAKDNIYKNPQHPYTKMLLEASDYQIKDIPRFKVTPAGCIFKDRCLKHTNQCDHKPQKKEVESGHFVSCWLV